MNTEAPGVGIIVLNWNGADDTLECLSSLQALEYPSYSILVVDNGSTDGSVERIRAAFPQVEILVLQENLLFAGGNNAGLRHLRDRGHKYILFLNNDTVVDLGFLDPLVACLEVNEEVGMVAPRILYHNSDRVWFDGGRVNLWTGRIVHENIRKPATGLATENRDCQYLSGCCILLSLDLALELGGFDEAFSMYGEDVDLSLRIRARGLRLRIIPGSMIRHKVSASMGGAFSASKGIRKLRAQLRLLSRHAVIYQWPTILLSLPVFWIWDLLRVAVLVLRGVR